MDLTTTTIGSYPKPDYLRIPEFVPKHQDPTHRYSEYLASIIDDDQERLERATRDNVQHQVAAGIDIPSAVDLDDFPKAPKEACFHLVPLLDEAAIHAGSLEDAHRYNDFALLDLFRPPSAGRLTIRDS
jgi:hypothetical protein